MNLSQLIPVVDYSTLLAASGVCVLLLAILFLIVYRRDQKLAEYETQINLEGKSKAWIEKKAGELTKVEAYRLAGDLNLHLERFEEAAELYKKGGNFFKAAESYLKAKNVDRAAEAWLESKDYARAASLFMQVQKHAQAAEAYLVAGDAVKAAETFEKAGDNERSARIYLDLGLYRRASRMFEKSQNHAKAADAVWRCHGQEKARLPDDLSARDSMPLRLLARQAGDLYRSAGRLEEAVEAYQAGKWTILTAEVLEQTSRLEEAALAYIEAGWLLKAASCYEKAGEDIQGAELRADYYLDLGHRKEALPYLKKAGRHDKAGEIHREFEEWNQAGESYERAGMFADASKCFEKSRDYARAAKASMAGGEYSTAANFYARAGDLGGQAEALEKSGDYIAAGTNYFERGLLDKAIHALQQVEFDDPQYAAASLLLGQIFREKGMNDLALEYFKRSTKDEEISRDNLENYYQLALCSERMGKSAQAASIFERIIVLDFHYKDVADRLNSIKSAQTVADSAPGSATGTPSGDRSPSITPTKGGGPAAAQVSRTGRYKLHKEIGRGGMGIVYKATDTILERTVAFKVLPSNLREHPQALKNFFREAKSAARLNHPNIVTVYDAGEENGAYYIAMEYIEGETVKQILNREKKLPVRAVLMIAGQICRALEYAHEKRIVHRDIKSSNVMWTPQKQVKIMDFGLAKVIEEVKGYQTIASGTPYYMSPEQTLGRNIDHRTDLYSLGVTMFEMATGRLPFIKGDASYHHVHTPPPEARSIDPSLPAGLNEVILRCMNKKPEERFADAKELFEALRKLYV